MSVGNQALECANKLEGVLRKYLDCNYNDFGVKANGNLMDGDWKNPINFALGHKYASETNNPNTKEAIDYFLGNELKGKNINDIISNYKYYSFDSVEDGYAYINKVIENLKEILFKTEW